MSRAVVVAGSGKRGFVEGPAAVAQFNWPWDVAVAPDGSYFVADTYNHRVRRIVDGTVSTVVGTEGHGGIDGPGEVATFDNPVGIVVDRTGAVFVTEIDGNRVRKIACTAVGGWVVSTVVAAGLRCPWGIAVDPAGHLVVADQGNHRVVRVDPATGAIAVIAGDGTRGFRDGPGATARFEHPAGVAVDRRGDIFVVDQGNHRVRRISAADGIVVTVAGSGANGRVDGAGPAAQFNYPDTVTVDGRGILLVNDGGWDTFRLRQIAASAERTVTTVAIDDAPDSRINGTAIDRDGTLLVAAPEVNRILRVTGLGLVPPFPSSWSLRAHRGLVTAAPKIKKFVTTVMLCAHRIDTAFYDDSKPTALPRLPFEMWLAILEMLPIHTMH